MVMTSTIPLWQATANHFGRLNTAQATLKIERCGISNSAGDLRTGAYQAWIRPVRPKSKNTGISWTWIRVSQLSAMAMTTAPAVSVSQRKTVFSALNKTRILARSSFHPTSLTTSTSNWTARTKTAYISEWSSSWPKKWSPMYPILRWMKLNIDSPTTFSTSTLIWKTARAKWNFSTK